MDAILEWSATLFSLVGAYLLATNTRASRWGWVAFSVANICMACFAVLIGRHGLLVQSLGFAGSSALGLYRTGFLTFGFMTDIYHRIYLFGYGGSLPPRFLRRLLAHTEMHRAWLAGFMGIYEQDGIKRGVIDRCWFRHRK